MTKALFSDFLEAEQILTSDSDLAEFGKDWCKDFSAAPSLVLLPRMIEQVQEIVGRCRENDLAIVPSGGRTGLSGGATATQGEVVVSLTKMNRILEVNSIDSTLTCQAGAVTEKVQQAAAEKELYFPVDLASSGSSQIGGNVATNAGGIHVIRYGNTREWVLGMKVVTGKGELLELNGLLVKNQTGYDLRSLLIGSEGTLGIIVELTLKLAPQPKDITRALCASENMEHILGLLGTLRKKFPRLSAFEFFTGTCLDYVLKHNSLRDPFEARHPFYGVLEIEDATAVESEALEQFLMEEFEAGRIADVVVSQSSSQAGELMELRERIGETASSHYSVHKNDLAVPVRCISDFLAEISEVTRREYPDFEVLLFGHVGDGNIHVNVLKPDGMEDSAFYALCHEKDPALFAAVQKFGGSISAEHGVGLLKKEFLPFSRSAEEIALMKGIKQVFDPDGILNPGKIF